MFYEAFTVISKNKEEIILKIHFLGGASTVTGSKFLLEEKNHRFLIDCGLFQGLKDLRLQNWASFPVDPSSIDFILLTHAHIDHSGYIPCLVKEGFKGKIYCTHATYDLAKIMLRDSAHLMEEDAHYANLKKFSKHTPALPLFDYSDVVKSLALFKPISYNEEIFLGDDFYATFIDAGHILGSASIVLEQKKNGIRIGFSGDLGRKNSPILKKPSFLKNLNYLVLESTYGDRVHPNIDPMDDLEHVIKETVARGGSIVIPAFAVGRAQNLLFYLSKLLEKKRIPNIPIYLNSPMASSASDIYCEHSKNHKLSAKECHDAFSIARFIKGIDESIALNKKPSPMIIISASGMATGGRVLHHLRRFLPDENSTILFTGYLARGTRGHSLMNGAKSVKIHGSQWPVKAKIINLETMSSHADRNEILEWIEDSKISPKKIFVVHGEKESAESLASAIQDRFTFQTVIPEMGESFEL